MQPKPIDEVLRETYDADPALRKRAVRQLCPCLLKLNDRQAWDRILELTRDGDLGVRRNALHTLIDGSPRDRESEVVGALEGMRDDPDAKLRRQVRKLLARYRRTGRINLNAH
jgi:HEAT repeat protein